jgi:DNA mismatch endonuclease, patch repair protein
MDTLSREHRSWNMSRIRGRDTNPEKMVRSALHRAGFRFKLQEKSLPGKPDIVLPKHRLIVLVHGCFWHRHRGCKFAYTPKSRKHFWNQKFGENVDRDRRNLRILRRLGWRVVVVWECETSDTLRLLDKCRRLIESS